MVLIGNIIYPIFIGCKQYTTDEYWRNIFEDLSIGKPPHRGIKFKNSNRNSGIIDDIIYCSYKLKGFEYIFSNKDAKEVYDNIYHLFTNNLKICSKQDQLDRITQLSSSSDNINSWSKIRKKSTKDIILNSYIIENSIKYGLDKKTMKKLLSIIILLITIHVILPGDIEIINSKIHNISGIEFENNSYIINKQLPHVKINDVFLILSPFKLDNVKDKIDLSNLWEEYLSIFYNLKNRCR